MGNRFPSGASGGWMADIWLLLETWLCFTVLEEQCPIFAVVLGMLCLPLVVSLCFRCVFLISGVGSGPVHSVSPFGGMLYESGQLTVEGSGPFWMVALF